MCVANSAEKKDAFKSTHWQYFVRTRPTRFVAIRIAERPLSSTRFFRSSKSQSIGRVLYEKFCSNTSSKSDRLARQKKQGPMGGAECAQNRRCPKTDQCHKPHAVKRRARSVASAGRTWILQWVANHKGSTLGGEQEPPDSSSGGDT